MTQPLPASGQSLPVEEPSTTHEEEPNALPRISDGTSTTTRNSSSKDFAAALLTTGQESSASESRFVTGRKELWAFYVYYIGNSGLGPYNFAPSQFQNLIYLQASNLGNGQCGSTGQPDCRLMFAGQERTVESIVLLCNGISFAIQAVLFLAIGSFADYGTNRPWILIISTVVAIAVSFAWLGVTQPEQWQTAIGLYMVGLISYQLCLSYWTAAFPGLARDLPHMREAREKLVQGATATATPATEPKENDNKDAASSSEPDDDSTSSNEDKMTAEKYSLLDMLAINRISNIAFTVSSVGELVILAVIQGMLYAIHADRDEVSNTKALSAIVAFSAGAWIICALPWFVLEKRRPGQPLPPGTNYFTAAVKQAYLAAKYLKQLRHTLIYIVFFFIASDSLSTTTTVISTLQNSVVSFSSTKLNILLIVGIAAQAVGIYAFWLIQKRFKLSTLYMLCWVMFFIVLEQVWGLVGIFTQSVGYHHVSEFYIWQAYYGIFVCPWYAFSQTMIAETAPRGYEFLFFSLANLVGKTSAFIGPFVTQAIANDTGNASTPFYFLLALSIAACVLLIPLDVKKSKVEQARFIELQAKEKNLNSTDLATPNAATALA